MEKEQLNYNFSADKNQQLILERGISFEEVITALGNGQLLDVIEHYNQARYHKQKMYVIELNSYVFLVPFVIQGKNSVFLKTIIPSRKAKKQYRKEVSNNEH